ncbi:MAG: toll/interleukin-1 receptor domain-containing protein [Pseudomonas proteolytica]|uniref:toll/interleukin-1 receptor domain-containing protein n=1 Tax=Pseudomonas proteolytica TaxID=219574 RepID=UPI003F2BF675
MAIRQSDLFYSATTRVPQGHVPKRSGQPTAFLSHSHKDMKLALGLQEALRREGWDVYIDWQDQAMPDSPDAVTASRIKNAIVAADWFLFLATQNSQASRWCPWEIGYADGKKRIEKIAIIPTTDNSGHHYGNEYLKLYNKVDRASGGGLALFDPQGKGKWVRFLK